MDLNKLTPASKQKILDKKLLRAVREGNVEALQTSINEGADVNAVSERSPDKNAAYIACLTETPNPQIIRLLFDNGARFDRGVTVKHPPECEPYTTTALDLLQSHCPGPLDVLFAEINEKMSQPQFIAPKDDKGAFFLGEKSASDPELRNSSLVKYTNPNAKGFAK